MIWVGGAEYDPRYWPGKHSVKPCKSSTAYFAGSFATVYGIGSTKTYVVGRGGRSRGWGYVLNKINNNNNKDNINEEYN